MEKIALKHAAIIRWTHWLNVPLLALMIWSGILIYWANDTYRVGYGDVTLFKFFPARFYAAFSINGHLAEGMALHFACMWALFLNGIIYVLYTLFSGRWRDLVPTKSSVFRDALHVVLHDLHLTQKPIPPRKFNAAQQIAYTLVVGMAALSVASGMAIYKPVQLSGFLALMGGYESARQLHFYLTMGYLVFFVVHITQVLRAGWNNGRAMITGYEMVEDDSTIP